jgi:hypothetical protein
MIAAPSPSHGEAKPRQKVPFNEQPADVVAAYLPAVTKEVARLRAARTPHIWITLDGAQGYVQCKPDLEDKAFYCEGQSAEANDAIAGLFTPGRIAILHMAGFEDPGRVENYSRLFPFRDFQNADLAKLLLVILRDVYGYDGSDLLQAHDELGDVTLMPK